MRTNQVLAVISNTATAGTTITTRVTGAATVTTTAEVETDIMMTGAATVATMIVDGDGRYMLRISVKTSVLHKFVDSLLKKINSHVYSGCLYMILPV